MNKKFDDGELVRVLGTRPRATFDRAGRVKLLGEAARALLAGELPEREARLFLAGALTSWLERGGDLARDYFRVVKPKSRHTAAYLWQQQSKAHPDERRKAEDGLSSGQPSPELDE